MDGDQYLNDVAFDPGTDRIVAVGADATDLDAQTALAWTSDDATSWLEADPIPGDANDGMGTVLFMPGRSGAPGTFIAGGWNGSGPQSNAAVWYSLDGSVWNRETSPGATYALGGRGAQSIRALVPYGRGGIAVYAFGVNGLGKSGEARLWRGLD
jgi:hypothetical protein